MPAATPLAAWGAGPYEDQYQPLEATHGPPLPGRLHLQPVLDRLRAQLGYQPSVRDLARLHVGHNYCAGGPDCVPRCWWSHSTWLRYSRDGLPEQHAERVAFAVGSWAEQLWVGQ